jgi:(p)ppGpp synthase/HD superfamily hydrolase
MLEKAIIFATQQHEGQTDRVGLPYILHPLYVMSKMDTLEEMTVAILHDVLEDTPATYDSLEVLFSKDIADTIQLLSRKSSETYKSYIDRIVESDNIIAKKVKLEDLRHNIKRCLDSKRHKQDTLDRYTRSYSKIKESLKCQ